MRRHERGATAAVLGVYVQETVLGVDPGGVKQQRQPRMTMRLDQEAMAASQTSSRTTDYAKKTAQFSTATLQVH